MKRKVIITLLAAASLMFLATAIWASAEFSKVQKPTPEQICVILGLEREISAVQKDIQGYYKDLLDDPCKFEEGGDPTTMDCRFYQIDKSSGWAIVPLASEMESFYGRRIRYVYAELGYIKWKEDKIESFRFEQKRTRLTGDSMIKILTGNAVIDPTIGVLKGDKAVSVDIDECLKMKPEEIEEKRKPVETPLNMFVKEVLQSGMGSKINFRFTSSDDVRDQTEEIITDGRKEKVQVVYVRNYSQKIDITREYLRLLKLMRRRIDWNSRAVNYRKQMEIERILKGK